jgi:hypothetical protein
MLNDELRLLSTRLRTIVETCEEKGYVGKDGNPVFGRSKFMSSAVSNSITALGKSLTYVEENVASEEERRRRALQEVSDVRKKAREMAERAKEMQVKKEELLKKAAEQEERYVEPN